MRIFFLKCIIEVLEVSLMFEGFFKKNRMQKEWGLKKIGM
jgi:hypothetical protein